MLKVGIIGASGFIGSRTREIFCVENIAQVKAIARSSSSLSHLAHTNLESCVADALDTTSLENALADCDMAIYCAAGSPWFLKQTAVSTYKAAEKARVRRLIYLSTAVVHGQAPPVGTNESSPLNDRQFIAYNNAKVWVERKLLQLSEKGTTEVVMLRPGIVVGPGSTWITGFANSLLSGTAYLVDQGQGICNSIYIDNLVHAMRLALTASDVNRQAFLVGDAETVTWADLYQPIAHSLGTDLSQLTNINCPEFTPTWKEQLREGLKNSNLLGSLLHFLSSQRKQHLQFPQQPALNQEMIWLYQCQYKLPHQKAQEQLNYSPIVSFEEACDRTKEWLASEGYPLISA
ncbi:MAG: NAD(P)H-binding protein [Oscillatoriales cyanobacterium RM2_1_1]|nr:NAD(P)H-binding protein [Oscillatoriales cyanobacterium SM2_3_0]NJO44416.1 NAD(P)H-binding protein [Oscillatoriales cyanobacterium RM2_1_1]